MIQSILNVALSNYGHLIPFGSKVTASEFLFNFRVTYCLENSHNNNVYTVVDHMKDRIEFFEHSLDGSKHIQFK
jgi:hypothetical protein